MKKIILLSSFFLLFTILVSLTFYWLNSTNQEYAPFKVFILGFGVIVIIYAFSCKEIFTRMKLLTITIIFSFAFTSCSKKTSCTRTEFGAYPKHQTIHYSGYVFQRLNINLFNDIIQNSTKNYHLFVYDFFINNNNKLALEKLENALQLADIHFIFTQKNILIDDYLTKVQNYKHLYDENFFLMDFNLYKNKHYEENLSQFFSKVSITQNLKELVAQNQFLILDEEKNKLLSWDEFNWQIHKIQSTEN